MRALRSTYLTLALSVGLFGLSHISQAADPSEPPAPASPSGSNAAAIEEPNPAQGADDGVETVIIKGEVLESVLGREVRTTGAEDMGRIVDLLADRTCQIRAAVIEFGGFLGIGTRKIAVEWSALRLDAESKPPMYILDMTREQLHKVPEYKSREPAVTRKSVN